MDHFHKLRSQITLRLFLTMSVTSLLALSTWWAIQSIFDLAGWLATILALLTSLVLSACFSLIISHQVLSPINALWQAILHVSPNHSGTPPPNIDTIKIGRELVTSLSLQVYQLAGGQGDLSASTHHAEDVVQASNIISHLPLPMFVCNKQQLVVNASDKAIEYCGLESSKLLGKPLFESAKLEFPSDQTLESWMDECLKSKATANMYWERVRVRMVSDETKLRQCDMAAYYNRDNSSGAEFIITMFDRTARYNQDDKSMGFVSLAVHELRTPLTVLRGYIEVFEEELADKLSPELKDFMNKLQVSAEQLASFVNNILNVARVEDNQLTLRLDKADWGDVLKKACSDNELRAKVHGKRIVYDIAEDLPPVAVDRVSIYEVVGNLLDNAIKYSAESKEIIVSSSLGQDGNIITTVRDFGVGVPESVLPNLFEKFYRNHRTRTEVGGTGLGLFLSKSIVNAHGGQIWAQSKEGQGSTFGFSLKPYSEVADELKTGNNAEITRTAHGWVKNHSLYRR